MIEIDDIVYTKKGKNANALAVVEKVTVGGMRLGRFGSKPENSKVSYVARYGDGSTLKFNAGAINKTVFKVE